MEALSGRDRDDEELSHLLEQLERVVEYVSTSHSSTDIDQNIRAEHSVKSRSGVRGGSRNL